MAQEKEKAGREKARKSGTLVQMQLKPFLDLIFLQILDHFL